MGLQPPRAQDLSADAFGSIRPYTVGVEEELFLVDPLTGEQINVSTAVQERVGPVGTVERELHACQLELITEVCDSASAAIEALDGLRRAVVATGVGLLGSGTHPSAAEGDSEITDKERYERIRYLLGDAVGDAGRRPAHPRGDARFRDGDPRLQRAAPPSAAAAGAGRQLALPPRSRHGLASAREVTLRGWPRSGAPRAMRDFEDFCATAALLARAADVPGLHVVLVEAAPAPAPRDRRDPRARRAGLARGHRRAGRPRRTAWPATPPSANPALDPPAEVLEEGMFRAARFGVAAELPDPDGRLRPVSELLEAALDEAGGHADELQCAAALDELPALLQRGGGAGRQRAAHEIGGMGALLRELTEVTAAGTAAPRERA